MRFAIALKNCFILARHTPIKERFRGGHKAITWAWLEDYDHRDVAIAICEIDYQQWRTLSSDLEGIILIWSKPPFNIRIPVRDEP